jgi:manganese-transporting P-type ATPase
MSTVSQVVAPGGGKKQTFVSVKGAPETLKSMYVKLPDGYEATYKWFAQRGSRVLALGYKTLSVAPESVIQL